MLTKQNKLTLQSAVIFGLIHKKLETLSKLNADRLISEAVTSLGAGITDLVQALNDIISYTKNDVVDVLYETVKEVNPSLESEQYMLHMMLEEFDEYIFPITLFYAQDKALPGYLVFDENGKISVADCTRFFTNPSPLSGAFGVGKLQLN